ncbi:MAG: Ig-like domain-containing protein [Methanobacteriaceae archaeon]|nr:Ig-like domain-containing protein [Methanobacteriaceae archaeon]MDO9626309.1 Ig-like domain-containing protein [Methanobacteriaceae archaeon]
MNGSGGNDSWDGQLVNYNGTSGPKLSIKNATGTVNENGTVHVANGVYSGSDNTGIIIDKNMVIMGQSQDRTIINGTNNAQIFNIASGINVTIQYLTITNGNATIGGAIVNNGNLTITNNTLTNNTALWGGVICNNGNLTITNNTLTNNTATYSGGAIYNNGNLTITHSTLNNNIATNGGAILNFYAYLTITHSILNNNTATYGGAIYNYNYYNNGNLTIINSILNNNTATQGGAIQNNYGNITITQTNLTQNTATQGGAIQNNYDGQLIVNFSRIAGNTATFGSAIYNYNPVNVNAQYNWWGSNNGPVGVNYGNITTNPWLILTITSNPSEIFNTQTSQITADLYKDSDGTDHQSEFLKYPAQIPVIFLTSWGTITQSSLEYGTGTVTYTANGLKPVNNPVQVYAIVDNGFAYTKINVVKIPTHIVMDNITSFPGQKINLMANVTDLNSTPVNEENITFKVNGISVGTANILSGLATLNWQVPSNWIAGTYNITAEYSGTNYQTNSTNSTLTLNHIPIKLTLNEVMAYKGKTLQLTANLWDTYHNKAISGQNVTFKVNGAIVGSGITNSNGMATLPYNDLTGTTRTITAEYTGNDQYNSSTSSAKIIGEKTFTLTVKNTGKARIHAVYYVTVYKPGTTKPTFKKYNFYLNPGKTSKFTIGTYPIGTAVSVDQFVYNTASSKKTISITNTWTATGLKTYTQKITVKNAPSKQKRAVHAKNRFWISKNTLNVLIVRKTSLK